jgi:hypothetical protein
MEAIFPWVYGLVLLVVILRRMAQPLRVTITRKDEPTQNIAAEILSRRVGFSVEWSETHCIAKACDCEVSCEDPEEALRLLLRLIDRPLCACTMPPKPSKETT